MTKLLDKTSNATAGVIIQRLKSLPCHTITFDNGSENKDWKSIEAQLLTQCYFANAYHSYERGTNENANGLIREYFPKKTDFTTMPEELKKPLVLHLQIECTFCGIDKISKLIYNVDIIENQYFNKV